MFVNGRLILEENEIESWLDKTRDEIRTFLETDERFKDMDLFVEVEYEDCCWNEETHHMWNEINITITNFGVVIPLGGQMTGQSRYGLSCLQFTTDTYAPQLVYKDGEFKFYHVFDLGSKGITDLVTFENNNKNGSFEDVITSEVLGM